MDHKAIYTDLRTRLETLVGGLDDAALAAPVPACPDWRVKDVVSHLTGIVDDSLAGNLGGVGSDGWTAAQVDKRREAPIGQILDEWEELAQRAAPMFENLPPEITASLIGDATTHEHDVRGALKDTEARDTEAVEVALGAYVRMLGQRVTEGGLPPVELRAGDEALAAGEGDPAASVTATSRFELLRALTGRRTEDEVRALTWHGDPDPYVGIFSSYGWPAAPLGE